MAAAARERVTLPTDDPEALAATLKELACANVFKVNKGEEADLQLAQLATRAARERAQHAARRESHARVEWTPSSSPPTRARTRQPEPSAPSAPRSPPRRPKPKGRTKTQRRRNG